MIKIKELTIRNFLSIGNVTQAISFDRQDLTLIIGENLDLGGDDHGARNGVGKTAIVNALSYALYGAPLNKIKRDNLINRTNRKHMMVSVEFEKDGKIYHIQRGRKPGILHFWEGSDEDFVEDEAQGDSRNTQKEIERAFGLSHDMFKHIVALNTYTEPFLAMGSNDQRNIIEQLLGITLLSEKADKLKEQIKETKSLIAEEEFRITADTDANNRIQTQIKNFERRQRLWIKNRELSITEIKEAIDTMSELDVDNEIQQHKLLAEWEDVARRLDDLKQRLSLHKRQKKKEEKHNEEIRQLHDDWEKDHKESLANLQAKLDGLMAIDIDSEIQAHKDLAVWLETERISTTYKSDLRAKKRAEKKEQKTIDKITEELATLKDSRCHTCGQPFHGEKQLETIAAKESQLETAVQHHGQLLEEIATIEAALSKITLGKKPSTHYEDIEEAYQHRTNVSTIQSQIASTQKERNPYTETFDTSKIEADIAVVEQEISEIDLDDKPTTYYDSLEDAFNHRSTLSNLEEQLKNKLAEKDPYAEQILEMREQALKEINYDDLNLYTQMLEHQEFLYKLLTNKDSYIRKRIIEQNLQHLNVRLEFYLDKIGLPHQVVFKNDLSVEITELGRDLDFDNLSRGERNRLILSLSWAFRDVWEALFQPITLLFVDELVDSGMDSKGVEAALAILKEIGRDRRKSVWLVSHREELASRVSNILKVTKENGYTNLNNGSDLI